MRTEKESNDGFERGERKILSLDEHNVSKYTRVITKSPAERRTGCEDGGVSRSRWYATRRQMRILGQLESENEFVILRRHGGACEDAYVHISRAI